MNPYSKDGIQLKGPSIGGKRREVRMARVVNQVFAMREQGMSKEEIGKKVHLRLGGIEAILHDPDYVRRRLTQYNEQLRAASPIAIKVVYEVLNSTAPQTLGERAAMAKWVLESTKTVGKESPVNVFIRGGDTNINLSNDTLEAAKAVAAAMRGSMEQRALPENVIDVVEITEENSNEHGTDTVGIVEPPVGPSSGNEGA